MLGGIALFLGLVVALMVVTVMRRRAAAGEHPGGTLVASPEATPAAFGWLSLVLGAAAVLSLAIGTGLTRQSDAPFAFLLLSMATGIAGLVFGLAGMGGSGCRRPDDPLPAGVCPDQRAVPRLTGRTGLSALQASRRFAAEIRYNSRYG